MRERSISDVPISALALLISGLCLQIGAHFMMPAQRSNMEALPRPPSASALSAVSMGEPIALAKLLSLYIQAFDNQPGVSVPYRKLDYGVLQEWLLRILTLDPPGQYPLFSASNLYGEVPYPAKQRVMLDFVYQQFFADPNRRWPWLAHAALIAKHQLHDLPLAQKYAHAIREKATGNGVPDWAKQMEIFLLEDMDELESAKILLGGLVTSGQIKDPRELHFLEERLADLEKKVKQRP